MAMDFILKKITYCILVLGILLSRLCLVSKYLGDVNTAPYIISLTHMLAPTLNKTLYVFNYEMSFGYYWLISIIYRLTQRDISQLIILQNYLSAVFGIFLILIFGILAKRLAGKVVAVFGMMILLLDHSLWNWSLYGHPTVLSIAFFLFSLYFFDRSITKEKVGLKFDIKSKQGCYLIISGLMGLVALLLRVDILFVFATYCLLWNYRLKDKNKNRRILLLFFGFIFSSYFIIKFLMLGYVVDFTGSTVSVHFYRQLELKNIPISLVTNIGLFAAGIGVFYAIGGLVSMAIWSVKNRRLLPATLISTIPVFFIAFFRNMDFARITIFVHPIVAFFAAIAVKRILLSLKRSFAEWGIGMIIVAYILQTAIVYHPLKIIWLRKFPFQPSPSIVVRPVPIGWFLSDRKNRLKDEKRLFQHALFLSQQKKNILAVCSRLHAHRLGVHLLQLCPGSTIEGKKIDTINYYCVYTPTNTYRIISCKSVDLFNRLSGSKDIDGYSVYFLNDLQFPYPINR